MKVLTKMSGSTALACLFVANAAQADVTAQEVWGDWRDYFESYGYEVSASESTSGDTLTVSGLAMAMVLPEDEGTFVMNMPEVTFTNQGDGSVAIGMPAKTTIDFDVAPEDGEKVDATIEMDLTGMATVVSGDPNDMSYSYTAASLDMSLTKLLVDDVKLDDVTFILSMADVIGQSTMKRGDMREAQQTFNTGTVTYEVRVVVPEEDSNFVITGDMESMRFSGDGILPNVIDAADPAALFRSGLSFGGRFEQGPTTQQITASDNGEPFSLESTSSGGELEFGIKDGAIVYNGNAKDIAVSVAGAEIPFPVSFDLEEAGYRLEFPMLASEEEQNFALGMTLGGLTVPDVLWNLFDAGAVLPRDPATVSFDLEGKTKLLKDLMDPELENSDEFPGELNALSLTDLVIELGGAELTGAGDFTFDNTDTDSFDGMPRPQGAADFRLLGGNGLLDKIVEMGFISSEDAMGARMMMGLFTRPGTAEDELTSRIEVNEQGHVMANGQRLK